MIGRLLRAFGVPDGPPPQVGPAPLPVPERATPSLAQEALICAIHPSSGVLWSTANYAVAAALLLELSREGRLEVSGTGKKTRVSVRDESPLGDPELDKALARLAANGPNLKLVRYVPFLPGAEQIISRLVEGGVLTQETHKRFGVFDRRRLDTTAAAHRDELAARLRSTLLGESLPDERSVLLISVFEVGIPFKFFVPKGRVREAYRRAGGIRSQLGEDEHALLSAVIFVQDKNSGGYDSGT